MDDLEEINQKLFDIIDSMRDSLLSRMQKVAKSAVDPMLQGMLKGMGIDMSQLRSMASGQMAIDPYSILGLDKSASDDEVKKRYLELVHVLHPDKSGTPATGRFFQMVHAAFEMIKRERGWQ